MMKTVGNIVLEITRQTLSSVRYIVVVAIALGLFVVSGVLIWFVTLDIPSVDGFHNRKVAQSTKIYDRTGKILLYDVHGTVRRTVVPIENVSRHIKNATLAIEDAEFYEHGGVKPTAILRAFIENLRSGERSQGGSTITQQVVKNTLLTTEKTYTRKIKEAILALKIEKQLSKDEIFEIYLNETPYGGTIYGIEEATQYFFAKSAQDATLAEAAYLAALPQAPTYFSPYGNHGDKLEERKNLVLLKMKENVFITDEEYKDALNEEVEFFAQSDTGIKAPHFVFYVREYLEEKYGINAVNEQGLSVITTLDYELQRKTEDIATEAALAGEENFNATNVGVVILDPKTGQILSMVGSRGYFDEDIDGKYNIALAERQPGSAFKPFVYATAFSKGYTPETVVFDLRTQFSTACDANFFETVGECYAPENYDNKYVGPVTLRNALAQSKNVPAVKVLYLTGVQNAIDTAHRMGITSLNEGAGFYGSSLVLGGGEVSLLDISSSYGVFATEGIRNPSVSVLEIKDSDGEILEEYEKNDSRVLDEQVARQVNSILSDNSARAPAFGEHSGMYFPGHDVAVKTGTTNDTRDVWAVGYTPDVVVSAWTGNNDNSPMVKKIAGAIIIPWWNEIMWESINRFPNNEFSEPDPVSEDLPPVLRGIWNQPGEGVHSILYWINKNNPLTGVPANPFADSQFLHWEYPVQVWVGGIIDSLPGLFSTSTPVTPSLITTPVQGSSFRISYPTENMRVRNGSLLTMSISHNNIQQVQKVSYYMNGMHVGSSTKMPFSMSFVPTVQGRVVLNVVSEGVSGRETDQVVFFVE